MSRGGQVKVVIINTEYVETDAMSFKSVVQSLTGKDSSTMAARRMMSKKKNYSDIVVKHDEQGVSTKMLEAQTNPILKKGMSFKDLDRLLMELPSMGELYQLCSD